MSGIISKIQNVFKKLPLWLINSPIFYCMSDESYLKMAFQVNMGQKLDLDNPKTFSEKLQWLKLHDRNDKYTMMVDKYLVRDYIREQLGEEYLIPLVGAWDDPDDIDFDALPDKFVLKCNHNSGLGMCICTDKSRLDFEKVRRELKRGLKQDYYLTNREWPYKNVTRKIICEDFLVDEASESNGGLVDYKFYCFNGYVDCVQVCIDRASGDTKFYFFDEDWNLKRINPIGKEAPEDFTLPRPNRLGEMFDIARKLSKGHPYLRVDLYECNDRIYFGELTFFPKSGYNSNLLPEGNQYFGDLIDLSLIQQ